MRRTIAIGVLGLMLCSSAALLAMPCGMMSCAESAGLRAPCHASGGAMDCCDEVGATPPASPAQKNATSALAVPDSPLAFEVDFSPLTQAVAGRRSAPQQPPERFLLYSALLL